MTKKDYTIIAQAIKNTYTYKVSRADRSAVHAVNMVAHDMAKTLERDNPRFDYEVFYKACGVWVE